MVDLFPEHAFGAFLFDMDGTLLTSIEASSRVWGRWAVQFGLDAMTFLPNSHGMRVSEVISRLSLPGVDADREAEDILAAELIDLEGIRAIAGAAEFLASLPNDRWAIVTSAPRALAERRLSAAGLPMPSVLVSAEDVRFGKPDPSCFLIAAQRLGVAADRCLVFEDAPAGVAAARAAGAQVVTITAVHRHVDPASDVEATDYRDLRTVAASQPLAWSLLRGPA